MVHVPFGMVALEETMSTRKVELFLEDVLKQAIENKEICFLKP